MVAFSVDGRIFAGLLMYAIAAAVYWGSPNWKPARWLGVYLVLRGTLNVVVPFSNETSFSGVVDPITAFTTHLQLAASFTGLIFVFAFVGVKQRWPAVSVSLLWLGAEILYLWDHAFVLDGPLRVIIALSSMAPFVMGALLLVAAQREPDLVRRKGLILGGVTSWAFPAFAGGYSTGWLIAWVAEGNTSMTLGYMAYLGTRLAVGAIIVGFALHWLGRRQTRSTFLISSFMLGALPWAFRSVGGDPGELSQGANALTTMAMPIGLGIAVARMQHYDLDGRLRRPFQMFIIGTFSAILFITVARGLRLDPPLDLAFFALAGAVVATIPWWMKWTSQLTKTALPVVAQELSLHARVLLLQSYFQRAPPGPVGRNRLEALATSLGIPRHLIDRLGAVIHRLR